MKSVLLELLSLIVVSGPITLLDGKSDKESADPHSLRVIHFDLDVFKPEICLQHPLGQVLRSENLWDFVFLKRCDEKSDALRVELQFDCC